MVMLYPQDERINVLAPIVRGRKGEFKKELAGAARARLHQGAHRRPVPLARGGHQARSPAQPHDRRRRRSPDRPRRRRAAADRVGRRRAQPRRRHRRHQLVRRRRPAVLAAAGVRRLRPEHAGDDAARLLVQLAARRVPRVPGARRDDRLRSAPRRAGRDRSRWPTARSRRGRSGDRKLVREALQSRCRATSASISTVPFAQLPREGARGRCCSAAAAKASKGCCPNLRRRYDEGSWAEQEELEPYRSLRPCPTCHGAAAEAAEPVGEGEGADDLRLRQPADRRGAATCSTALRADRSRERSSPSGILREIQERLRFLNDVGVGYLTLGRSAATLSGGEGQRIRLATQIGANLTGVLYVLDEPSIGLHQRDNREAARRRWRGCAISATP